MRRWILLVEPAQLAGIFLALVIGVAVLAPWVMPYSSLDQDLGRALELPTPDHLLGTDDLGRDIMSRLMLGSRTSVIVGFGSALLATMTGTTAGLVAGYRDRMFAALVMRCSDVLLAFPAVVLAMVVATVLRAGLPRIILATASSASPASYGWPTL
jgi:glutathione transport system permease protein